MWYKTRFPSDHSNSAKNCCLKINTQKALDKTTQIIREGFGYRRKKIILVLLFSVPVCVQRDCKSLRAACDPCSHLLPLSLFCFLLPPPLALITAETNTLRKLQTLSASSLQACVCIVNVIRVIGALVTTHPVPYAAAVSCSLSTTKRVPSV